MVRKGTTSARLVTALVLVTGAGLRLWASRRGHNFDYESYRIVAGIMEDGGNVYAETERYNYGPIWSYVLALLQNVSELFPDPEAAFRIALVTLLTLADVGIWAILHRRYGRIAGFVFFLNPVSIVITGFHNQFDNLAILAGLAAMLVYSVAALPGLLLLGVSLTVKHILLAFPLWLAVKEKGWEMKLSALVVPPAVLAVSFAPFLGEGRSGIVSNVFLYRGHDNAPFWHAVLPAQLQSWISPFALLAAVLVVLAFVWRRRDPVDLVLLYLLTIVLFAPAIANQYLALAIPAIAAFPSLAFVPYQVLSTWMLTIHPDGLHHAWLRDRSPGSIVQEQVGLRVYDPLIAALSLGFAVVLFPGLRELPRRAWEWVAREAKAQRELLGGREG